MTLNVYRIRFSLRQNKSSEKDYFFLITTCNPSIYTMDNPDLMNRESSIISPTGKCPFNFYTLTLLGQMEFPIKLHSIVCSFTGNSIGPKRVKVLKLKGHSM